VRLDWHAVHDVKVLMDEIFGYENFRNEVVWRRANAHNDPMRFGMITDTLLFYGASDDAKWNDVHVPYGADYIDSHWRRSDSRGRYRLIPLDAPRHGEGGNLVYEWKGKWPARSRTWAYVEDKMREFDAKGLIEYTSTGTPNLKRYLDETPGLPAQNLWDDIPPVNPMALERLGYPTQKPVALLERLIQASSPPGGLVLDCFMGSGTTAEAAERLGRRWIGLDNGKYAVHLARKRLIQLHGQPKAPEKTQYDYVECKACKNIERKEKSTKARETYQVRPFTVENMGVYQRAEQWQDFQSQKSRYRDEMIRVFGGDPGGVGLYLHGKKGNEWVHVGPLDGAVSVTQIWSIAREASRTETKRVTVLSADFDTLSASDKDGIEKQTGVHVTIRVIPISAIDEVRRRIELQTVAGERAVESMAIPAFYAPLSIVLGVKTTGRLARVALERCEIDIQSFLTSQQPVLRAVTDGMSATARKKAEAERKKWDERKRDLEAWLKKADTWQKFIDFWAIDWDYGHQIGPDERPIFDTAWQSFRLRKAKGEVEPLTFAAEFRNAEPGAYRIAARVTDVFGNDGIATVHCEVG
jgi:hypothetical protein